MSKFIGDVSAYAYAVSKGYTGTEEEYAELMAAYADVGQTAVDAAESALNSKTDAQTAAQTATSKASEATTAAQTATTKAAEASTNASTAVSAKDTAVSASQMATTKATEATTAAGTATTAKNDAVTAKTAAETAQGKAETAQGAAEDAAESVSASAAQIAQNTSDISDVKEDLTQKANIDGSYEDLVSGGAYQIISNMEEVDNTPYNYRTAGGSLEIGDREKLKKIVGGSLAVNQIIGISTTESGTRNGITFTNNGDGSWTINGTSSEAGRVNYTLGSIAVELVIGHKYILFGGLDSTVKIAIYGMGNASNNGGIFSYSENANKYFRLDSSVSVSVSYSNVKIYPQLFDLTAMFGTTIADYVYSLETATAGAGVAWLKSHFPKIFDSGYIPYNAGTLEHVSGLSAHKMVGFNQWDEEWESGSYNFLTGEKQADSSKIRCKNLIEILPNTVYYKYCGAGDTKMYWNVYYDANGNYLSRSGSNANGTFTTPSDAYYMSFNCESTYGTTYNHNICINLHCDGERDGEYEPYEEHSYPLDSDVTLRGIPKLDANNNLYYDGDEYAADGTVTRRYGIVDLGTLPWTLAQQGYFYATVTGIKQTANYDSKISLACPVYENDTPNHVFAGSYGKDKIMSGHPSGAYVWIRNNAYETDASFKTAMSGVYLLYELATPTTESADPYIEIQNVSNWGTEEFVTTSLVPVGHETAYQPDLRAKIEVAPESPDTDGLYLMKRENGQNSYVAYLGELPSDPTTDGTYTLKCTVASGTATKTWEADE